MVQEEETNSARALIELVLEVYSSFTPASHTPDAHADNILKEKRVDHAEAMFVKQVFYGTVRYKKLLRAFLSAFYHKNR